eukprot:1681061-Rhodomonas_salina.1
MDPSPHSPTACGALVRAHEPSAHVAPSGHVTQMSPDDELSGYKCWWHSHAAGESCPEPDVKDNAGQSTHCPTSIAPTTSPNVSGGHGVQSCAPEEPLYVPARHGVHT